MGKRSEEEKYEGDLHVPHRAWTDGGEDISTAITSIVNVFNDLIDHKNFSGAAITFVLHKLAEIYIRTMFHQFSADDSNRSSVYVMTAQMMNSNMDLYDEIRAKMPEHILRLIEEPTQGDA